MVGVTDDSQETQRLIYLLVGLSVFAGFWIIDSFFTWLTVRRGKGRRMTEDQRQQLILEAREALQRAFTRPKEEWDAWAEELWNARNEKGPRN